MKTTSKEPKALTNLLARPEATEAILLFPGIGGHPWALQPMMSALETDREIFAVDWSSSSLSTILQELPDHLAGRPVCLVGFSLGVQIARAQLKLLSNLDVRVSSFLAIDGACSASFYDRAKRLLLSRREKRRSRRLKGVERYLAVRRSLGWRHAAFGVGYKIDVPCGVVSTRLETRSMVEKDWRQQCKGDLKLRFLDSDHLKLVQSPIPRSLVEAVRSLDVI